jgi:hypothetical protein
MIERTSREISDVVFHLKGLKAEEGIGIGATQIRGSPHTQNLVSSLEFESNDRFPRLYGWLSAPPCPAIISTWKQIEISSISRHQHLPLQNFLSTLSSAAFGALSCLCSNSLLCFSTSACLLSLFPSPGWLLSWIFGELLLLSLPWPIEPPVGLDPVSLASLDLAPPDCAEASSGDLPEPPFVGPARVPCPSEGGSGPGCSACCFVPLEAPWC